MPKTVPPPLALALSWLREAAGLTQKELAAAAGVTPNLLSSSENGSRPLQRDDVHALVAPIGYSADQIDLVVFLAHVLRVAAPPAGPAAPTEAAPPERQLAKCAAGRIALTTAQLGDATFAQLLIARRLASDRAAAAALGRQILALPQRKRTLIVEHSRRFQSWA